MTEKTVSAGERLRVDLDNALAQASRDLGRRLEWTEMEAHAIEHAAFATTRAEVIRSLLDAELVRPEPRPSVVVRLSAEARLCERQAVDLLARVNPGLGQANLAQYRRVTHGRWHPSQGSA